MFHEIRQRESDTDFAPNMKQRYLPKHTNRITHKKAFIQVGSLYATQAYHDTKNTIV